MTKCASCGLETMEVGPRSLAKEVEEGQRGWDSHNSSQIPEL